MNGYNEATKAKPEVGREIKIIGHGFGIHARLNDEGVCVAKVGGVERNKEYDQVHYWKYADE